MKLATCKDGSRGAQPVVVSRDLRTAHYASSAAARLRQALDLFKTRNVRAGSIVGSGSVSNKAEAKDCSCVAGRRAIETIEPGAPATPFMRFGNRVRVGTKGADGAGLFGAIEQRVRRAAQA